MNTGPISWAEIQELTGLGDDAIRAAVEELQRLFLIPSPRLIDEVERFDLNINTRTLVRDLTEGSELYRRIAGASQAVTGEAYASRRRREAVGQYIRQTIFLQKQGDQTNAERTLKKGLDEYPNEPSLLGQLGWLYRQWAPTRRVADAREYFLRAAQLKCRNVDMYYHWAEMECRQNEWVKAADAATSGIDVLGEAPELLFWRGYAGSRQGKELALELQAKGRDYLISAEKDLRKSLRDPTQLTSYRERFLNTRIFRAIALNLDAQLDFYVGTDPDELRRRTMDRLKSILMTWSAEHPDDDFARSESARLNEKFRLGIDARGRQ